MLSATRWASRRHTAASWASDAAAASAAVSASASATSSGASSLQPDAAHAFTAAAAAFSSLRAAVKLSTRESLHRAVSLWSKGRRIGGFGRTSSTAAASHCGGP